MPTRTRLTNTFIKNLTEPGTYRDDVVRGLHVVVTEHNKLWRVQTTKHGTRKTLRKSLGRCEDIPVEQARDKARAILKDNRAGHVIEKAPTAATLQEALDDYIERLRIRGGSAKHIYNIERRFKKHLKDWLPLPIDKITAAMCKTRHKTIARGKHYRQADSVMENLRAVFGKRPDNPVTAGVKFYRAPPAPIKAMASTRDVAAFWRACEGSPLKRFLRLQLLSALRPGHLKATRVEWVDLDRRAINYPRLKRGEPFALPLSGPMMDQVAPQVALANDLGSPWLFPSMSAASGHIEEHIDRKLAKAGWPQGHSLRKTWASTAATLPDVPTGIRMVLMDHSVSGIQMFYVSEAALWDALMDAQEKISRALTRDVLHFI